MDAAFEILSATGPWGLLAAGFVWIVVWMTRMADRLDALDKAEHGRMPKVEKRVTELETDIAEIKTDVAVAAKNTEWIKDHLDRALRAKEPTR